MKIDIAHVAKLANLPLPSEEMNRFEKQLSSILDYIKKLEEVSTSDIQETNNITGLENISKNDAIMPSLTQDEVLSNTKKKHNGLFLVDAILEQGDL